MTSHYLDFDAVTHSIKDVSVSTINRLLLPNCSGFMGKSRINSCQNLKRNFAQVPQQSEFTQSGYLVTAEHLYPQRQAPAVARRYVSSLPLKRSKNEPPSISGLQANTRKRTLAYFEFCISLDRFFWLALERIIHRNVFNVPLCPCRAFAVARRCAPSRAASPHRDLNLNPKKGVNLTRMHILMYTNKYI